MLGRYQAMTVMAVVLLLIGACGASTPTDAPRATQIPPPMKLTSPTASPAPPTPVPATATPAPPAATPAVAPTKTKTASKETEIELEPEPTVALTTVEEFRFESGDFTVVGDLQIPNTEGAHPAVIMVHGDGRIDRTDRGKYLPLMKRFLRAGYAVLSWDKPGTGASTGQLARDSDVLGQRATILADAVELLALHPAIDPERIGVWGISQAGYVMPLALTMTDSVAFMVVISGPAMDSYDQGAFLVGQLAYCAGASEEEARLIERRISALEKATTYQEYLDNIEPLHEDPILKELGIFRGIRPEDQWLPEDRSRPGFFNPIEIIERTFIPVLAVFAERDRQVDPFQGARAYGEALRTAGSQASHVELYPDADHNIVLAETGCLDERAVRPQSAWLKYAPGYLDLMEEWLLELSESMD